MNAPSTAASGWLRSTSAGPDADVPPPVDERRRADEPHDHVHLARGRDVLGRDPLEPLVGDVVERHARAERDGGEDRHLRRGVLPGDVLGRIGLREAEPLRLGERLVVGRAALHLGEHEVRRPVDDPEHAVDVRDDERLAQHLDHRDRRADRGLEAELDTAVRRRGEQLGAAARDELLVRGHDRLAGPQELEHVVAGRVEPAHHLGDDGDLGVVADLGEVGRRPAPSVAAILRRVADERPHDAQPVPGRPLDVGRLVAQQPVDRGADRPVPEQRNRNVDRRHAATVPQPSTRASRRSVAHDVGPTRSRFRAHAAPTLGGGVTPHPCGDRTGERVHVSVTCPGRFRANSYPCGDDRRASRPRRLLRRGRAARGSGAAAASRSSSAATRTGAAWSRPRTTSPGGSASTRR